MLAVGEIHAPLFPRILYVEYLLSVSSYCLLVCSFFPIYLLLEIISFLLRSLELLLCFTLTLFREVVLLHWCIVLIVGKFWLQSLA